MSLIMGWMYMHKKTRMSVKEFFEEKFNFKCAKTGASGRVLDCAVVNLRTAYIAYETVSAGGRRDVMGIVCLLGYNPHGYHNFGYKDIDESMCPSKCDCPERILNLLTPTDAPWAQEWRQRCRENLERRKKRVPLRNGAMIMFDEPIGFSDGTRLAQFWVMDAKKGYFSNVCNGRRYKVGRQTIRNRPWKVVTEKEALCYELKRVAQVIEPTIPADRERLLRYARNLVDIADFTLEIGRDISEDEVLGHFSECAQGLSETG